MTKEKMMDKVIEFLGFENEMTIWFCEVAEVLTASQLEKAFVLVMTANYEEEEV